VVSLSGTEDLHHGHQQAVSASSHVDGFDGEPHGIDADHRSSSRSQAAQSEATVTGQVTATFVGPRVSSICSRPCEISFHPAVKVGMTQ
jgi:hypothetical protein